MMLEAFADEDHLPDPKPVDKETAVDVDGLTVDVTFGDPRTLVNELHIDDLRHSNLGFGCTPYIDTPL